MELNIGDRFIGSILHNQKVCKVRGEVISSTHVELTLQYPYYNPNPVVLVVPMDADFNIDKVFP